MTEVAIVGIGMHPFGRHPGVSGATMGAHAIRRALADAGVEWPDIQFAYGGSLASNGNSASVTFATGRALYRAGGYTPGPLTISPATIPVTTQLDDPLATLAALKVAGVDTRRVKGWGRIFDV